MPGYERTGVLGRGSMSIVYAARDPTFGRQVAVKLLRPSQNPDAAARRFRREAAITGRLAHEAVGKTTSG